MNAVLMKTENQYAFRQTVGAHRGFIHALPPLEKLSIQDYDRNSMDHAVIYAVMGEDGYNVFLHSALWSVQSLLMRTDAIERGVPVYILAEKQYQDEIYKRTDLAGMPREWIIFFEENVPIPEDGRRLLKRLEIGWHSEIIQYDKVLLLDADCFFMGPSFPLFYRLGIFHEYIDCIALFGQFFRMKPWKNSVCVRETESEKLEFLSTAMGLPLSEAEFIYNRNLRIMMGFVSIKTKCFDGMLPWFKKYVSDFIDNEPVLSMWICMQKLSFLPINTLIPFTSDYEVAKKKSIIFHTFNQDNMPIDFMELLLEGL